VYRERERERERERKRRTYMPYSSIAKVVRKTSYLKEEEDGKKLGFNLGLTLNPRLQPCNPEESGTND